MASLAEFGPAVLGLFGLYYFGFVARKPKIYGRNKAQLDFLHGLPILDETYYPSPLYINGVVQTIFGLFRRPKDRMTYTREIFSLSDGGEIALDFKLQEKSSDNGTIVIIFPGLSSSSQTSYIKTLVQACYDGGSSVVVMNFRGMGGVSLKTTRTFSATYAEDMREVIAYVDQKYPLMRKMALPISMGAMLFGNYLLQYPKEAEKHLECALTLCNCWDAHKATISVERPIYKQLVSYALADAYKTYIRKHRAVLSKCWDIDDVCKRSHTLRDFDNNFTAPQFGYKSVTNYYEDITLGQRIKKFTIPVFGFSAYDDPMQPGYVLPYSEAQDEGSKLVLILTSRGGHLGFLEGLFPSTRKEHYMERFVRDFVRRFQTVKLNKGKTSSC